MEKSSTSSVLLATSTSLSENQSKTDEKRRFRKQKDEKAILDLKERIPDIENIFDIHGRIGNGTFSTVLLATLKCEMNISKERRRMFAIKHLIPTSHPNRIHKELKCLVEIGGKDNVAGIDLCLRRQESVAFVMPYIPHERFQDFFDKMNLQEVQNYIRNLLFALKRVHSFNVIHRDVKPSNFLHNRKTGQFMLVDFGLAQSVNHSEGINPNKSGVSDTVGTSGLSTPRINNEQKRKATESDLFTSNMKKPRENENSDFKSTLQTPKFSPFKMPLKQFNEIIPPKNSLKGNSNEFDSLLTREVKSAVLGVSMTKKLQERANIVSSLQVKAPSKISVKPNDCLPSGSNDTVLPATSTTTKYNRSPNISTTTSNTKCCCYGKNQVCNVCLVKKDIPASRAGTPGYRPPEVLLKYTEQTTAVDIWAVGVIFIAILSAVYPFFKAPDDFMALAEIVTIFGDESIRRTAFVLSRHVCMSRKCKPLDLRKLCVRLRNRHKIDRRKIIEDAKLNGKQTEECKNCQQYSFDCLCVDSKYKTEPIGNDIFPSSAYELLGKLLDVNPHKRITAEEALKHQFFNENFS